MKQIKNILLALLISCMAFGFAKIDSHAAQIIINDSADLLTEEEEKMLYETMEKIAEYGGVAFETNPSSNYISSASGYAKDKCREYFKGDSGTVLLIDMYNRRIEIYSTGYLYRKINKHRANAITDNTYNYATLGRYYDCANETLNQMATVLEGGKISTPLKYISNLLMAFGVSTMFFYIILYFQRRSSYIIGKDNNLEDKSIMANKNVIVTKNVMTDRKKTRHVESSGSSDSSGGYSSGGGGFSGGGSSGGGGGHSF